MPRPNVGGLRLYDKFWFMIGSFDSLSKDDKQ